MVTKDSTKKFLKRCLIRLLRNWAFWLALAPLLVQTWRYSAARQREITGISDKQQRCLLVLSSQLFRHGDLEKLSEHPEIKLFFLDPRIQNLLVDAFNRSGCDAMAYYHPEKKEFGNYEREALRKRIRVFVRVLTRLHNIQAVLTHNVRHLSDLEWAHVSEGLAIPNVLLFREGLVMYPRVYDATVQRHKMFGRFSGSRILVHNEATRRAFIESGFATRNQIRVSGCLRMSGIAAKVVESESIVAKRQILWLFFSPGQRQIDSYDDLGFRPAGIPLKLYEEFLQGLFRYLERDEDATLVIRPKQGLDWDLTKAREAQDTFHNFCGVESGKRRVSIDNQTPIHEAIMNAKVVCGMQTSAILEAAVFKKDVIIPYFRDYRGKSWEQVVAFRHYPDLFLLAADPEDLGIKLGNALNADSIISDEVLRERRALFEEWLSPLKEDITNIYYRQLVEVINEKDHGSIAK